MDNTINLISKFSKYRFKIAVFLTAIIMIPLCSVSIIELWNYWDSIGKIIYTEETKPQAIFAMTYLLGIVGLVISVFLTYPLIYRFLGFYEYSIRINMYDEEPGDELYEKCMYGDSHCHIEDSDNIGFYIFVCFLWVIILPVIGIVVSGQYVFNLLNKGIRNFIEKQYYG